MLPSMLPQDSPRRGRAWSDGVRSWTRRLGCALGSRGAAFLGVLILAGWFGCSAPEPAPRRPSPGPSQGQRRATSPTPRRDANAWTREIEPWLGTPYRTGGNDRRGVDCSGFVQQIVGRVAGQRLPRTTTEQFRFGTPVARLDVRPGDLVFFATSGRGVSHVGIAVGAGWFAHASTSRGVMYSELGDPYWNRCWLGARRPFRAGQKP